MLTLPYPRWWCSSRPCSTLCPDCSDWYLQTAAYQQVNNTSHVLLYHYLFLAPAQYVGTKYLASIMEYFPVNPARASSSALFRTRRTMCVCVELCARCPLLQERSVLLVGEYLLVWVRPFIVPDNINYIYLHRFDKCLKMGMKLEAIREDRTRGGRSTYQCSYTIPPELHASLPPGIPEYRTTQDRSAKPPEIPHLLQVLIHYSWMVSIYQTWLLQRTF